MAIETLQKQILKQKLVLSRENKTSLFANYMAGKALRRRKNIRGPEMPSRLMVEPTNLCTLHCPTCPTGSGSSKRLPATMPIETFKNIVRQVQDYIFSITLFNYGEPFLNPNVTDMMSYAASRKVWVWTSTNGLALQSASLASEVVRSGLHYLVICIDGASQETLEKFRQDAEFDAIIEGISNVVSAKKKHRSITPFVEIQFIVMKHNLDETEKIKNIAHNLGVYRTIIKNVGISLAEPDLEAMIDALCPDTSFKDALYKNERGEYRFKAPHPGKCPFLHSCTVINANGDVVPCCYDLQGEYVMGNIYRDTIAGIWNGNLYRRFRREFLESPENIALCTICPEGRTKIW